MSFSRRGQRALLASTVAGTIAAAGFVVATPAVAETLPVSPTGTFVVTMNGNGHGHGMSQYGARGAAIAGKTYQQILSFYYPGTTLTKVVANPWIRVRLGVAGTTDTVAPAPTLNVSHYGALSSTGVSKYRLVADTQTTLDLQELPNTAGAQWTLVKYGLPDGSEFYRTDHGTTRLYLPDGSSTTYYGNLRALRGASKGTSGGVYTVDVIPWDQYTAGVVPREMPASWSTAAVDAQAVAARTYVAYQVAHPMALHYDICDSSQCQVYGGHAHYDAHGTLLYSDDLPAATATSDQVLEYKSAAIFAQFSASDGGWTVSGGQPYLPAKADPYDSAASGDPYLDYAKTVSVKSVAAYFGLAKVTELVVSSRDGNGAWGGRVLSGSVVGTDTSGKAKTVSATGFDFEDAFGIGTTWFHLTPSG